MKTAQFKTAVGITLLMTLTGCSQESKQAKVPETQSGISGHLFGVDGQPMKYAQVLVTPLKGDRIANLQTFTVAADGSYAVPLDKHQRYHVSYIGVGHLRTQLIVDYNGQKNLGADVALDRLNYLAESEKVQLDVYFYEKAAVDQKSVNDGKKAGSKEDKGELKKEVFPMTQIDKGHYKITKQLPAGQIRYQLTGLTLQKWGGENPQAEQFEHYRNGYFYSLADHSGGDWTLDLTLPNHTKFKSDKPVVLSGDWHQQTHSIELQTRFNRLLNEQNDARAKNKEGKFVFHQGIKQLERWRAEFPQDDLQQLISVMATTLWGQPQSLYQQVFKTVPSDSWYWSVPRADFNNSLYRSGKVEGQKQEYNAVMIAQNKVYQAEVELFLTGNDNDAQKAKVMAYLADAYRWADDYDTYQRYYDRFKISFSHVQYFDFYNKFLSPSKVPVGSSAPDFSIADMNQPQINYSKESMKGKVYLLDFWATWCGPCIKEMPVLHQTYEQFKSKGFEILSISADDVPLDVANYRKGEWTMPWKHAFLDNGNHPIKDAYFVFGYPMAFLIDENGKVLANGDKVRGEKLVKTLTNYFAKSGVVSTQ